MLPLMTSSPFSGWPRLSIEAEALGVAEVPTASLPHPGNPRASAHKLFCDHLNSFHERLTLKSTTSPIFNPRSASGTTSSAVQSLKSERPFHCTVAFHPLSPSRLSSKLPCAFS